MIKNDILTSKIDIIHEKQQQASAMKRRKVTAEDQPEAFKKGRGRPKKDMVETE